jgi:hypothetical protein
LEVVSASFETIAPLALKALLIDGLSKPPTHPKPPETSATSETSETSKLLKHQGLGVSKAPGSKERRWSFACDSHFGTGSYFGVLTP